MFNRPLSKYAKSKLIIENQLLLFILVDCEWLPWKEWGPCSVSCGGGRQIRKRFFKPAAFEGKECEGRRFEVQKCNIVNCPSKLNLIIIININNNICGPYYSKW